MVFANICCCKRALSPAKGLLPADISFSLRKSANVKAKLLLRSLDLLNLLHLLQWVESEHSRRQLPTRTLALTDQALELADSLSLALSGESFGFDVYTGGLTTQSASCAICDALTHKLTGGTGNAPAGQALRQTALTCSQIRSTRSRGLTLHPSNRLSGESWLLYILEASLDQAIQLRIICHTSQSTKASLEHVLHPASGPIQEHTHLSILSRRLRLLVLSDLSIDRALVCILSLHLVQELLDRRHEVLCRVRHSPDRRLLCLLSLSRLCR
jgi:hypothetical protein